MDLCHHQTYKIFSASCSDPTACSVTSTPSYSTVVSDLLITDSREGSSE